MKRLIVIALGLALAPLAGAQLYKYIDKDGKTVYTDQPPASAKSESIRVQPASPPSAAPKTSLERDKELQKARDAQKEKGKKADESAKAAQDKEANCNTAKVAYQHYQDGGKIIKYNAQGERELMSDDEIAAGLVKSKREMDEACKP